MWQKTLFAFCNSILLGALIGWTSAGSRPATQPSATARGAMPARPVPRAKWSNADFVDSLRERSARWGEIGRNPLAGKLSDWSDGEIIAALNASLSDPDIMLPTGSGKGLATYLLAEWMRRDMAAALAWFDKLESRSVQSILGSKLDDLWPRDKAEEGLAFLRSHPGVFSSCDQIIVNVLGSRAKQGTTAVVGLLEIMRKEKIDFSIGHPVDFPAGFDFPALIRSDEFKSLWDRDGSTMFLRGWCAQDRDGAFNWLLENHGVKSLSDNMLMSPGDFEGHMKWLGSRIDALDPDERAEYIDSKRGGWLQFPGVLVDFVKGVSDPALLDEIRAIGVQSIRGGHAQQVIPLLESISDPAKRIEILETTPPPGAKDKRFIVPRFNQVDEAQLRKKLAEWDAPPDRIDAIIARFKP
jgi:hypothetical protein